MSRNNLRGQLLYNPPPPTYQTTPSSDTNRSMSPALPPRAVSSLSPYGRRSQVSTQPYTEEETEELLPRCAACLLDFGKCQYPCSFPCKHIYCTKCLLKLKDSGDEYKCPYDSTISPVVSTKCDLGFYNRIDYFRKSMRLHPDNPRLPHQLNQLRKEINCNSVPCRGMIYAGKCVLKGKCPYDHSKTKLAIACKFTDIDRKSCWECKVCLLTVSTQLPRCPVCDRLQPPPCSQVIPSVPLLPPPNRKPTNATLDLSVLADDEKNRQRVYGSELSSCVSPHFGEPVKDEASPNQAVVKVSKCCELQ